MNSTEVYNPFGRIWAFTQQYFSIIHDELSNDNALEFYAQGWAKHDDASADLEQFTWEGWERHAEYCIAVFGPSVMCAIAAYRMWENRNAPLLPAPYVPKQPIAFLPPVGEAMPTIDTDWIDWKAYLELIFNVRRFA